MQYVPVKPSWHWQLNCPPAWLRQRPRGPHTLDEIKRTPPGVLLDATATVQLSITEGGRQGVVRQWSRSREQFLPSKSSVHLQTYPAPRLKHWPPL
ncbi:hypothetical protein EYF80_059545 [Liparis tanakae]|uniref:Uncharacterized protein n=1 Tax=Liparis tanakae TaxID=230148 RepID=A0A4Z2ENC5_9TELE|nr:hypothetical protein EYF80_059545 [Liparis tanakae]